MKKGILNSTFLLVLIVVLLVACQKVDNNKIPPVIILKGSNPQWLVIGCEYNDPGIDVIDDKSDTLNVWVTDNINSDSVGDYYVNYTVVDADSNVSMAKRKVIVEPRSIDDYVGNYMVFDTVPPFLVATTYQASVTIKNINPPLLEITNFNDYGENFKVLFTSDSIGPITLNYDKNDTIIDGTGTAFCDKTGFRLEFLVELPDGLSEYHKATFKLNGNNKN